MALITNIQHFMDGDNIVDDLPDEVQELVQFLTKVIEASTEAYDDSIPSAFVSSCRNDKLCEGDIITWISLDDDQIHWGCTDCDDSGIITGWEGTRWDNRNLTRH